MAYEIHKAGVRKELAPRPNDPYWAAPLERGVALGFRKLDADRGSWTARRERDDAAGKKGNARYEYHSLGSVTATFDYAAAVTKAREWAGHKLQGIPDELPTVETVCKEYVEDRRTEKGDDTAYDAEVRFKRSVYDTTLGKTPLAIGKLTTKKLKDWRAALPGEKAHQDREFRSLKAALNLAVRNRRCPPMIAIEWKSVPAHKGADKQRDVYLDLEQRRALIAAATGGARDLIEAAALTGARPGELVKLRVGDFDTRTKTVKFRKGKTGGRSVPVSDTACALFKRLSKDKLPAAYMLTMDDGEPWTHSTWWADAIREAAAAARVPGREGKAAELPAGVVLYTLRHSWITEALRGGMATLDVARLTGTSLQMIQSHYGHLVADSARERLAAVTML